MLPLAGTVRRLIWSRNPQGMSEELRVALYPLLFVVIILFTIRLWPVARLRLSIDVLSLSAAAGSLFMCAHMTCHVQVFHVILLPLLWNSWVSWAWRLHGLSVYLTTGSVSTNGLPGSLVYSLWSLTTSLRCGMRPWPVICRHDACVAVNGPAVKLFVKRFHS